MSIFTRIYRRIRNLDRIDALRQNVHDLLLSYDQLQFLLNQAPMLEVPSAYYITGGNGTSLYVYINPVDLSRMPGAASNWIPTEFIPQGRMIFSPNRMPGLEEK